MTRHTYRVPRMESVGSQQAINAILAAARDGNPRAQLVLAKAFEIGAGVEPDMAQALHWYRLAAETLLRLAG